MPSSREVQLIFKIVDQASKELVGIRKELEALQKLQGAYQKTQQSTQQTNQEGQKGTQQWTGLMGKLATAVGAVGIAYVGIKTAIADVAAVGQGFYRDFIASNERLNQQIISSAANIAAVQDVIKDGVRINDPAEAIAVLQPKLKEVLKQVQQDSIELVGVTSAELTQVFQILSSNVAKLSNQSTKGLVDPLEAAGKLTIDFAAALGTVNIPLAQAAQEINSILRGTIDQNSALAIQLGITPQMVAQWKAQGILVDELRNKLAAFSEGNKAAAQSISAAVSNIRDVYEVVTRMAGESLLAPVVDVLKQVERFALDNQESFTRFATVLTDQVVVAFNEIKDAIAPLVQSLLPVLGDLFTTIEQLAPLIGELSVKTIQETLVPAIELLVRGLESLQAVTQAVEDLATIVNGELLGGVDDTKSSIFELGDYLLKVVPNAGISLKTIVAIADRLAEIGNDPRIQKLVKVAEFLSKFSFNPTSGLGVVDKVLSRIGLKAEQVRDDAAAIAEDGTSIDVDTSSLEIANKDIADLGTSAEQLDAKLENALTRLRNPTDATELQQSAKESIDFINQSVEAGRISAEEGRNLLSEIANNVDVDLATQQKAQADITKIVQQESKLRQDAIAQEITDVKQKTETGAISRIESERQITALTQEQIDLRLAALREEIARREAAGEDGSAIAQLRQQEQALINEKETLQIDSEKRLTQLAIDEGQKRVDALALEQKQIEAQVLRGEITRSESERRITENAIAQVNARADAINKALETAQGSEKTKLTQQLQELNIERERLAIEGAQKVQAAQLQEFDRAQDAALDTLRLAETQRITELERLRQQEPELAARIERQIIEQRKQGLAETLRLEQERLAFLQSQPELSGEAELERQDKIRASRQRTAELTQQLVEQEAAAQRAITAEINAEIDKRTQQITNSLQAQTQEYEKQVQLIQMAAQAESTRLDLLNAQKSLVQSRAGLEQTVFQIAIAATEDEKKKGRIAEKAAQAKLAAKVRELEIDAQIFEVQEVQRKLEQESEKIQARIAQIKSRAALAEAQATAAKTLADPTATKEQKQAALLGVKAAEIGVVASDATTALTDFKAQTADELSGLRREAFENQQNNELLNARFEATQAIADPGQRSRALTQLSRESQSLFGVDANPYVRTITVGQPSKTGQQSSFMDGITTGFEDLFGGISEGLDNLLQGFNVSLGNFGNPLSGNTPLSQTTSVAQNNITIQQVNFTNRIERASDRAQLDKLRRGITDDLTQMFNQAAAQA